ncbi:MAG: MarR family transcriptional regulator [Firmicutes bacterium]|nr:MarR family transcriptional regulator [Bacillota bacterium]MCL5040509.1 MarR family transcriptional regulator [Bacillota bacterium]
MISEEKKGEYLARFESLFRQAMRRFHWDRAAAWPQLTRPQLLFLRYLAERGTSRVTDVARELEITPGAVTSLCNGLVKLGLIARRRGETDRREVFLSLSPAGQNLLQATDRLRQQKLELLLEKLTEEEIETFFRLWERIIEILG